MSSLSAGTRLGTYEVVGPLGAGGMGEVYRARDTTLDRDAALKILPASFASDPDRLMRFEREAKTLASLNHPNIAQVYGVIPASADQEPLPHGPAIAMELVEGSTLAELIPTDVAAAPSADGRLEWALPLARQVASALESAHESGIVHRDLKPANIIVRHDGTVKVLDFGLAKAVQGDASGPGQPQPSAASMNSPTVTSPALTALGLVLGTAAYMSPEQARGRPVDRRADIWAFGVVLYEMLAGRRPFAGDEVTDILAAVLKDTPDWRALPEGTPARIRLLLTRCLEKSPTRRLRDIGDARLEIDDVLDNDAPPAGTASPGARPPRWWIAALALVALAAVVGPWIAWTSKPVPDRPTRTFEVALSPQGRGQLSPDGSRFAFVTNPGGMVAVRDLEDGAIQDLAPLPGENRGIRWSPDGQTVLAVSWNPMSPTWSSRSSFSLFAFPIEGGSRRQLFERERILGVAPTRDGEVLVQTSEGIERLSLAGGQPQVLLSTNDLADLSAPFGQVPPLALVTGLTDESFVFIHQRPEGPRLERWTNRTLELIRVLPPEWVSSFAHYLGGPYLYLEDRGAGPGTSDIYAVPFDPASGRSDGEPILVAERVIAFTASAAGDLYYRTVPAESGDAFDDEVVWVNRRGEVASSVARFPSRGVRDLRISPDGQQLAVLVGRFAEASELWVYDLARQSAAPRELPLAGGSGFVSLLGWMPDSAGVVFQRATAANPGAFVLPIGGGAPTPLFPEPNTNSALSGSGRRLARYSVEGTGRVDLIPVSPDGQLGDAVRTKVPPAIWQRNGPRNLYLSPDGQWIVHRATADERGEPRVVLERFPEGAPPSYRLGVSGVPAAWSRAGDLFLIEGDGAASTLVLVRVDTEGDVTVGSPETLFPLSALGRNRAPFDTVDGQRLITVRRHSHESVTREEPRDWYVQNWPGSVRR